MNNIIIVPYGMTCKLFSTRYTKISPILQGNKENYYPGFGSRNSQCHIREFTKGGNSQVSIRILAMFTPAIKMTITRFMDSEMTGIPGICTRINFIFD